MEGSLRLVIRESLRMAEAFGSSEGWPASHSLGGGFERERYLLARRVEDRGRS